MTGADAEAEPPVLLLLETDVLARFALAEYLRACGYRVVETASAAEAEEALAHGLPIAAALIDVRADPDGFQVAKAVRAAHPNADVILVGGVAAGADKAGDLCDRGPTLSRPYEPAQVVDLIRRLQAARDASARG